MTEEKDQTSTKRPHVTKNDTGQHLGWHKIRRHLLLRSQENTDRNTPKRCEESSEEYPRFSQMTPHNCPIRRPLSSEASRHRDGWRQSTRTSCHLPIALPAAHRPPACRRGRSGKRRQAPRSLTPREAHIHTARSTVPF